MSVYYGLVGFAKPVEVEPGIWEDKVIERPYRGTKSNYFISWVAADMSRLDRTNSTFSISIIADSYAIENQYYVKYVEVNGVYWKVEKVEPNRPRLELTLGGVYNGQTLRTSRDSGRDSAPP